MSTEGNDKPGAPSTSRVWTRSNDSPAEHDRQAELIRRGRSIMDLVGGEAKSLQRKLGSGDRDKLDAWFTSVRELEGRPVATEAWIRNPKPKVSLEPPVNVPRNNEVAVEKIFLDIVYMALASDSTMQGMDVGGQNPNFQNKQATNRVSQVFKPTDSDTLATDLFSEHYGIKIGDQHRIAGPMASPMLCPFVP